MKKLTLQAIITALLLISTINCFAQEFDQIHVNNYSELKWGDKLDLSKFTYYSSGNSIDSYIWKDEPARPYKILITYSFYKDKLCLTSQIYHNFKDSMEDFDSIQKQLGKPNQSYSGDLLSSNKWSHGNIMIATYANGPKPPFQIFTYNTLYTPPNFKL